MKYCNIFLILLGTQIVGTPQQRVPTLYVYIKNMKITYAPVNPILLNDYDKTWFLLTCTLKQSRRSALW